MMRCVEAGHLVAVDDLRELPGELRRRGRRRPTPASCSWPASTTTASCRRARSARSPVLDGHRPGCHRLHVLPGYGHLDVFMGQHAAEDVFPMILEELDDGAAVTIPRRVERQAGATPSSTASRFTLPVNSRGHARADGRASRSTPPRRRRCCPATSCTRCASPAAAACSSSPSIDYRDTDIGSYIEYCIAIACTHGARPGRRAAGRAARRAALRDRPVRRRPAGQQRRSRSRAARASGACRSTRRNLDFRDRATRQMSSQYDLDGQLCMRITVDRPRFDRLAGAAPQRRCDQLLRSSAAC